jgi:hypothetical protein
VCCDCFVTANGNAVMVYSGNTMHMLIDGTSAVVDAVCLADLEVVHGLSREAAGNAVTPVCQS